MQNVNKNIYYNKIENKSIAFEGILILARFHYDKCASTPILSPR